MNLDDAEPVSKKKDQKNLDILSVESLHEYIEGLLEEIERAKEFISLKENAKENADTFFK